MGEYRIYCLNGAGQIGFARSFEADSDEDAMSKARELYPDARKCELWAGHELVATLGAEGNFELTHDHELS